ncbi:uncharacterized protein LOC120191302 [Hibiscus syriacus]|uniref:uncharacterized protein LOC120191302 n=1 Tax=Hibiscus syriacus TaxID=106335 RepID=UPI00192099D8|nr:uncharacterized protein LOC120191302 [Hibiscus syriacus]
MGRVKLQIRRIENTTNRQVTFSKRRNGLVKKAYELSVLCDVDVALLMFSPSGRLSLFSGNKSIEEILEKYVNLPEHERGRLRNKELLVKTLGKLRDEADSPVSSDSKELQQEIVECKFRIADMQKRLNIFEGEPAEITTLIQAEFHEQFLEETLKQVRLQKQVLQEKYNSFKAPDAADVSGFVTGSTSDWIPQKDPQVQILNFLDSNGLLPQRDQCENILPPQSTTLLDGEETINVCHDMQRPEFEQVIDVNLSPWTQLYPTGDPMMILFSKLKRLKQSLKRFNKDNFSSISDRVKAKRIELEKQQLLSLKGEDAIEKELAIHDELKILKEAERWVKNTKFFHSMVAFKNKRDTIRVFVDKRGNRLESFDSMAKEVINFFTNLIGNVDPSVKAIDPNFIKSILNYNLSYEASSCLVKEVIAEEIKEVIFDQGNDKAPVPDGFSPLFFNKAWNIVGKDVIAAVKHFFLNASLIPSFNSTVVALAPKIPNPSSPFHAAQLFTNPLPKFLSKD